MGIDGIENLKPQKEKRFVRALEREINVAINKAIVKEKIGGETEGGAQSNETLES